MLIDSKVYVYYMNIMKNIADVHYSTYAIHAAIEFNFSELTGKAFFSKNCFIN